MPHTTTTLAQLKVSMQQRWDQAVFWTPEEARLAINEALRVWNFLVGRWHTTAILTLTGGQYQYPLPSSLVFGARVSILNQGPIYVTSTAELDLVRPEWRGETTTTGGDVPGQVVHWAPEGLQTIDLWPTPATTVTGGLFIDGVAATPILVEEANFIDLGEELHDLLLDYALHVVAFKEGGARWMATIPFVVELLKQAAEENRLLKASRAYRTYAGLDRRRDLQPTRPGTTRLDPLVQQAQSLLLGGGSGAAR